MAKWISFKEVGSSPSGKTRKWHVCPTRAPESIIGTIEWYDRWRKYVFAPGWETVFEEDCLRDIAAFCEQQTAEHERQKPAPVRGLFG